MKKLVIFVLFLAAAGAGAYYYFVVDKVVEKPTVNKAPITRGEITEVVQSTGTLEPMRTVQVGSQVSGVVQNLYVDFNSIVSKDQVIARIDPTLLELQVKIQEANIAQREGDIDNQKVQLEQDKKNLERVRQQVEKGLLNQQQLEQSELAVRTREASITNSQRSLLSLQANLDQAKQNVAYTTIKAPVDGVVVNRHVDVGQTVQSSVNVAQFFTIATDLRELKLSAGVDEAEIGKVQAGQRVLFTVDAWPGQEFEGIVDTVRLNASNQNNVVTYPVWIKVTNNQLRLKPSMTASIRIVIQSVPNVLRVSNGALRWKPNNEIYVALGLQPPAAGRPINRGNETDNGNGGAAARGRDGGRGANASAPGTATTGTPAATGPQQARGGDAQVERGGAGRQSGSGRTPSTGFGGGGNVNLTPEQRKEMMARFQQQGGRGNGAGSGRSRDGQGGGRGGGITRPGTNVNEEKKALDAQKIDELFEPIVRREQPGTVWTWDEEKKELKEHRITVGVTDGSFSEIVRGDGIEAGMQVVTGVVMPQTNANRPGQGGNIFGQQPGRNPGGMMPGNFGNPGGGGPGGGGGGRGGGGGGRGGGN